MDHLTDFEISDYVRGLVTSERLVRAKDHVSQCGRCAETAAFYERVRSAAFVCEPVPQELVGQAKALFQAKEKITARPKFARRVLPAISGWAMAGVRSALQSGAAKHVVYECGDFCVDLRSEVQPDTVRVSLVGQLANQSDPHQEFETVLVRLVAGKKTLEHTECNRLGEFALSFAPARRLHLEIELTTPSGTLKVPLKDLNPEEMTI